MPVITCSAAQRRRGRLRRARCCRSRQPWRTGYGGIPSPGGGLRTADELVGCERHQLVSIAAFDPSCRAKDVWEQPPSTKNLHSRNSDVGLFLDGDSAIFVEGSRFFAASFDA